MPLLQHVPPEVLNQIISYLTPVRGHFTKVRVADVVVVNRAADEEKDDAELESDDEIPIPLAVQSRYGYAAGVSIEEQTRMIEDYFDIIQESREKRDETSFDDNLEEDFEEDLIHAGEAKRGFHDILALSRTCNLLRSLSIPFLYGDVDGAALNLLVRTLLERPEYGIYINKVIISSKMDYTGALTTELADKFNESFDKYDVVDNVGCRVSVKGGEESEQNNDSAMLPLSLLASKLAVLVVCHSPRLKHLSLHLSSDDTSYCYIPVARKGPLLLQLATLSFDIRFPFGFGPSPVDASMSQKKVSEYYQSILDLAPNLRVLSGINIAGFERLSHQTLPAIVMQGIFIRPNEAEQIFRQFPLLTTFVYQTGGLDLHTNKSGATPMHLVQAASSSHSTRFDYFELDIGDPTQPFTLHGLGTKTLKMDLRSFARWNYESAQTFFRRLLPHDMEILILTGHRAWQTPTALAQVMVIEKEFTSIEEVWLPVGDVDDARRARYYYDLPTICSRVRWRVYVPQGLLNHLPLWAPEAAHILGSKRI